MITELRLLQNRAQSLAEAGTHAFPREAVFQQWWMRTRQQTDNRCRRLVLVQSISFFRIIAILTFAALALGNVPLQLLFWLYSFAIASDLIDGYLARRLGAVSYFGRVMDLVADKALTIVSLLYAAERGINLLPLAIIATRDIIMLGLRLVRVDGKQILPTNRVFGGLMATMLGINTLTLLYASNMRIPNAIYWLSAVIFLANLIHRLHASAPHLAKALLDDAALEKTSTSQTAG